MTEEQGIAFMCVWERYKWKLVINNQEHIHKKMEDNEQLNYFLNLYF
jgi:hypothetical protein